MRLVRKSCDLLDRAPGTSLNRSVPHSDTQMQGSAHLIAVRDGERGVGPAEAMTKRAPSKESFRLAGSHLGRPGVPASIFLCPAQQEDVLHVRL